MLILYSMDMLILVDTLGIMLGCPSHFLFKRSLHKSGCSNAIHKTDPLLIRPTLQKWLSRSSTEKPPPTGEQPRRRVQRENLKAPPPPLYLPPTTPPTSPPPPRRSQAQTHPSRGSLRASIWSPVAPSVVPQAKRSTSPRSSSSSEPSRAARGCSKQKPTPKKRTTAIPAKTTKPGVVAKETAENHGRSKSSCKKHACCHKKKQGTPNKNHPFCSRKPPTMPRPFVQGKKGCHTSARFNHKAT